MSTNDYGPGGIVGGGEGVRAWSRGPCPLDGYPLVEFEPHPPYVEGGWEHIIPFAERENASEVLRRIADAHAFEAVAAAEQIATFGRPG